jgi:Spy/CpxP family protein refolding chaperone
MLERRIDLGVLGVTICLSAMGCMRAVETSVATAHPTVQDQGSRKVEFSRADDDLVLCRLLILESVQTDLGLSADQVGELSDLIKTSQERSRQFAAESGDVVSPSRSVPSEELEARQQQFLARLENFRREGAEFRRKILAVLTPRQRERLEQIALQAATPIAITRPEIIKELGISKDQCERIGPLCDRMKQKQVAAWPNLRGVAPLEQAKRTVEFMKASDQSQKEATRQILDVLTPEQRAKFEKLTGKKLDLERRYDALTPEELEFWRF